MPASNLAIGEWWASIYLEILLLECQPFAHSSVWSDLVENNRRLCFSLLPCRHCAPDQGCGTSHQVDRYRCLCVDHQSDFFRNATSVFGPPPIPGEGPGGRGGGRQRPSERHSGSETVPADIRIGNDGHCNKLMGCKICI